MNGTPLPAKLPPRLQNAPSILGAYPQILKYEKNAQAAYSDNKSDHCKKNLICARILGYLILEGPSDDARVAVALEVIACNGEEEKFESIGELYLVHYIRAFKRNKGRTPAPSKHVSRPSFETRKELIKDMLVEAPQNHKQAKSNALVRDGFRCVISKHYDHTSVNHSKELTLEMEEADADMCPTECAHIFPESTNANVSGKNAKDNKVHYASSVWAVLERFGYTKAFDELNGSGIHRLENILTLNLNAHFYFDTLQFWLEPVQPVIPNTYKLCAANPHLIRRWKSTVTFTSPDPVKLPVPSATYLELHAACCRVANLSGASEYVDKYYRDMDDIPVLSQDGSSAETLKFALMPHSTYQGHSSSL